MLLSTKDIFSSSSKANSELLDNLEEVFPRGWYTGMDDRQMWTLVFEYINYILHAILISYDS